MACEGETEAEASPAFGEQALVISWQGALSALPTSAASRLPHSLSQVGDAGLPGRQGLRSEPCPSHLCLSLTAWHPHSILIYHQT